MQDYQLLSEAAHCLRVTEALLLELRDNGWIAIVDRNGLRFVTSHDLYKARYILHLRDVRKLTDAQIQLVLSSQRPPYSTREVDQILSSNGSAAVSAV
ncbi:MAG: hypothetical protein ACK5AZ_03840 [Bryobacteraceae bacterium]